MARVLLENIVRRFLKDEAAISAEILQTHDTLSSTTSTAYYLSYSAEVRWYWIDPVIFFFFFLQKDLSAFLEKRAPALFIYLVIAIVFLHGVFFVQFYGKGLPQQFDSI